MSDDIIKRLREAIAELFSPNAYVMARSDYDLACHPANITALLDRLDKAERENERLNEIVEKKFLDSTVIRELSVRNGGLDMQVEGGPCMLFADAFADFLVESGAENYVEVSFTSEKRPEIGRIAVTVQRLAGKTPHELRREAEQESERLRAENEALAADARRYRFIRDTPWGPDLINVIQMQMNGKWDAAIDAAMAAEKGKE